MLFHVHAITFLKLSCNLATQVVTSGVQLFQMPIFFPYKIIAINCKQELNLMVAYGDFDMMMCFYCSFLCAFFDDEQFY